MLNLFLLFLLFVVIFAVCAFVIEIPLFFSVVIATIITGVLAWLFLSN